MLDVLIRYEHSRQHLLLSTSRIDRFKTSPFNKFHRVIQTMIFSLLIIRHLDNFLNFIEYLKLCFTMPIFFSFLIHYGLFNFWHVHQSVIYDSG